MVEIKTFQLRGMWKSQWKWHHHDNCTRCRRLSNCNEDYQERVIRQLQEQQQHSEQVLQLQQDLAISISGILFTSQSEMR